MEMMMVKMALIVVIFMVKPAIITMMQMNKLQIMMIVSINITMMQMIKLPMMMLVRIYNG